MIFINDETDIPKSRNNTKLCSPLTSNMIGITKITEMCTKYYVLIKNKS